MNSTENVNSLKKEVVDLTGGKLDYLVNNAGRNYTVPALDIEIDEVQAVFETNVVGVMRMCQAFAPLLIEGKGTIVQIGSVAAIVYVGYLPPLFLESAPVPGTNSSNRPYVFGSVYNASKAALHSYSSSLRLELAPFDVRVVTVITGGVKSNIARVDRELKPDSLYLPVSAEYERRVKHSQEVGMDTKKYAASVVQQLTHRGIPARLFGNRDWIWEGAMARVVWFVSTFLPNTLFVSLVSCPLLLAIFLRPLDRGAD